MYALMLGTIKDWCCYVTFSFLSIYCRCSCLALCRVCICFWWTDWITMDSSAGVPCTR